MNIFRSSIIKSSSIAALTLLLTVAAQAQNTPVLTETAPAGTANTVPTPPVLPYPNNTGDYNYTRTLTPAVPFTNPQDVSGSSAATDVRISTTFRDGFNRDMQTIVRNFTNNAKPHLVIPSDTRFRRDDYTYLPYAITNDYSTAAEPQAQYNADPFGLQQTYYSVLYPGEGYTAFSRSTYVSDISQRSTITYAPGKSQVGQGRGTKSTIVTNNAGEIRMWSLNASGQPVSNGFYPADQLAGTLVESSEGSTVAAYKDKDGNLVCRREYLEEAGSVYGYTYYVYDELGRLCYTIPPKATDLIVNGTLDNTVLADLCYIYRYDSRGLLTEQQLPGKAVEYFVYDQKKRLVLYQDGAMRAQPTYRGQGIWRFTFYDALDRPTVTGTCIQPENRVQMQAYIYDGNTYSPDHWLHYVKHYDQSLGYPASIFDGVLLSFTYYDDYSIADPNGAVWNTYTSVLQFTEQVSTPGSETPWKGNRTKGKVTGSRVRILTAPGADASRTGEWRETVNFYDDKGRVFYTVSKDLYQGNAIHQHYTGRQYDFANRVLISKHIAGNSYGNGLQQHTELERSFYDPFTGRLTQTRRKTDNGSWAVQLVNSYDELGRLKRKTLGSFGEVQDYSYNIRGQLAGINDYYARTGDRQGEAKTFGEILSYDYGFSQPRTDGKVAGMVWRGAGGTAPHAYGYSYDKAGRMTLADYRRYEPPSNGYLGYAWRKDQADYTTSNLSYDKNGNLMTLNRRAVKNGTLVTMDDLNYSYEHNGQSNRLRAVTDNAAFYDLGDFNNTNGSNDDYLYTPSGSLSADYNKQLNAVQYNVLDKPEVLELGSGAVIRYSYDALGNKVQELLERPGQNAKRTDYVGNYIYEDDNLQYALTAEGRSVYDKATTTFKEEYFVKDHLGNVRSVIDLLAYPIQQYLATYEVASANLEGLFFEHHDEVRDDKPGGSPGDNKAGNLYGADPEHRIGTSLLMKVMAGDRVELNVNNYYENYNPEEDEPVNMEEMLATLVETLTAGNGGFQGSESHEVKLVDNAFTADNYQQFTDILNNSSNPEQPRAYLNYLFYDERMQLVPELSGAFQANGNGTWTQIGTTAPIEIGQNGYLAVYLSNASQGGQCEPCSHVFFDQLVVNYSRGNLKAENHYYPFGQPINSLSAVAGSFTPNRHLYQSNEYRQDAGLNWMDFHNRQYDPQLGRFLAVDPMAAATAYMSPYTGMNNNPVSVVDPLGLIGEYLTHPPLQGYYSQSAAYQGSLSGRTPGFHGAANENSPGGVASWFFSVSVALGNKEAQGRSVLGEVDPGVTKRELIKDGWIIDGSNNTSIQVHRGSGENLEQGNYVRSSVSAWSYDYFAWSALAGGSGGEPKGKGWDAANTTLGAYGFGSGIKEAMIEGGAALGRGVKVYNVNTTSMIRTYGVAGAKYLKFSKSLGVVGSVVSTGYSMGKVVDQYNTGGWSEVGSHRDALDAGVGIVGLGATGLAAVGIISNPIGWGIGIGVLIYGGATLIYDAVNND